MNILRKRNINQSQFITVNQHSQVPSTLSTISHSFKQLSLLMCTTLLLSIACTPPCRFNEEENCELDGEMMGGEMMGAEINIGEGSGSGVAVAVAVAVVVAVAVAVAVAVVVAVVAAD